MAESLNLRIAQGSLKSVSGLILFAMVRNEDYFLPHFFAHYRNLGIAWFVIYDDHSDTTTTNYLTAQPDCVILRSDNRFGDTFGADRSGVPRRLPMVVKESVPERLLAGRWVLTVDADEFLVLPEGFADLPAFVSHLERIGQVYATAPMIDFYGESLDHRNHDLALGPFAANAYFDAGPYYYWTGGLGPVAFMGGVRHRLLKVLCQRRPDLVASVFNNRMPGPAKCWKVPLLKHGQGITRIGDHEISEPPRAEVAAALAHFKFSPDLDAKIEGALRERQYYSGSIEYAFLKAVIDFMGSESLIGPETRRFDGADSLARAGLLPKIGEP
jgi:hypothetical protein